MRKKALLVVLVGALAAATLAAWAQPYPSKRPIQLVVGFAPGGGADIIARDLNIKLSEILNQSVIVMNRVGAGGTLASDYVAKSAPDGYTVGFSVNSHAINQALFPTLPFDTERDLRGVTLIGSLAQALAAHPSAPANTLQEFLQQSKGGNARSKTFASGGIGSPGHFAAAYLESLAKVDLIHVPYRGAGPAITDVIGNHVPYIFATLSSLLPQIKAGKLKAIAVTSRERSPLLPNVPTIAESGFPGYDTDTWIGTFVPRATPDAVVGILHKATVEALKDPVIRGRIESQAGRVIGGSPQQLDALVNSDIKKLSRIVKERGIKPE